MSRLPQILDDSITLELSRQTKALTADQQAEINKIRRYWYAIARCIESHFTELKDPFVTGEISNINPEFEDLILRWSDMQIKLRHLIFVGFDAIKMEADRLRGEFPFDAPYKLAGTVLRMEVSESVRDIFHPYKVISASKISKRLKYAVDKLPDLPLDSPIPAQLPEMRQLSNQKKYSVWYWDEFLVLTLAVSALQKAPCPNRELIAQSLQQCRSAQESLIGEVYLPGYRRRGRWAEIFCGSYAWIGGKKVPWNPDTKGYD